MRGLTPTSVAVAVALACTSTVLMAQEITSAVRGSVSTPDGAPVAGTTVTVVHTPSGTTNTVVTGEGGTFALTGLRPGGPYKITFSASGYADASLNNISLAVGEPLSVPMVLGEEELDEALITSRSVALTTGPTSTYDRETIEGIASVQRDIRDIARRDPFASFNPNTRGVYIAGQNNRTNRIAVDGVRFSDNFGLQQGGLPTGRGPVPLDAVEALSVKVAPYDVSEGDLQGGSINMVMRSGGNDFKGSVFYTYTSDGLTGDKTRGRDVNLDFTSKNMGVFLSGPIIQDKLFFAVAAEDLKETNPVSVGLAGAPSVVPNLTSTQVDQVAADAQSIYGYDTGGVLTSYPEKDRKFTAKLDWNASENQRVSYTTIYQNASYYGSAGGGSTSSTSPYLNYRSYSTYEPQRVRSHVLALNSTWGNGFSTEARVNYRTASQVPNSLGMPGFGQFQVCLDPTDAGGNTSCTSGTPSLYFGTERFSQADVVKQKSYGAELVGRLNVGDHSLKALASYQVLEITNTFVQQSLGIFYFDSLASFRAKQASSLTWQYSITGDLADVDASFNYDQATIGLQDSWNFAPGWNLTYGVRMDAYLMDDNPLENPNFVRRYGFTNTSTIGGLGAVQPRVSATWKPLTVPGLTLRAGAGLFNGGAPDVFVGNSFSVVGVNGNTISFTRGTAACTNNAAACAAALDNVSGLALPERTALMNYLATNTAALAASPVNAMDPEFRLPSTWKANLAVEYLADLSDYHLGSGWTFGADLYQSWVKDAALYTDLRLTKVGTAPDGRPIYADTYTGNGSNQDLYMTNTGKGKSSIWSAHMGKDWEWGLGVGVSYTHEDVKSLSDMGDANSGGSTSSGTYSASPMFDPNYPAYGTSSYETKHNWKFNVDFGRAFFGDNKTRFSLFGEMRSGSPYSLTMNAPATGNRSFLGVGGSNRFLLYVPDVSSQTADPLVTYATTADYTKLRDYVLAKGLKQGEVIGKNTLRSPQFFKVDLHLEQEVPLVLGGAKLSAFADIENLLNLIDDKYGRFSYYSPNSTVVGTLSCAATSGTNCTQYRYAGVNAPNLSTTGRQSLWAARLGVKISF